MNKTRQPMWGSLSKKTPVSEEKVKFHCSHCGFPSTDADSCDQCGTPRNSGVREDGAVIRLPRTLRARKRAYLKAANGKPLVEWMFEQCDKAAGFAPSK